MVFLQGTALDMMEDVNAGIAWVVVQDTALWRGSKAGVPGGPILWGAAQHDDPPDPGELLGIKCTL